MTKTKLSFTERLTLGYVLLVVLIAFALFFFHPSSLDIYLEEDGIVEWLTVIGLVAGFIVCISRFFKLLKLKSWWFLTITLVLGLLLFMAAGEEISWGQRILGIKSSEYFLKHNAQGETNLHNLVVDGVKLNKLIFSIGLTIAMGVYLLVFPVLYKYHGGTKRFIDRSGIPLPRAHQVISMLLVFVITSLLPHEKKAEMLEAGIALLFFLVIRYPGNLSVFDPSVQLPKTS